MPDNPIKRSLELTLTKLAALFPPMLPVNSEAYDFQCVREHLEDVATIIDAHIRTVGIEVRSSSRSNIDVSVFENVLSDALDGWTLPEITREIERHNEDRTAA